MNALARFLADHDLSQSDFGRLIGVGGAVVCRWLSGKRTPGVRFAILIEKATNGKVPVASWVDPKLPKRPAA